MQKFSSDFLWIHFTFYTMLLLLLCSILVNRLIIVKITWKFIDNWNCFKQLIWTIKYVFPDFLKDHIWKITTVQVKNLRMKNLYRWLRILKFLSNIFQFGLFRRQVLRRLWRHFRHVLDVRRQGEDVEVVVDDDASLVRRQRQNESFVESRKKWN